MAHNGVEIIKKVIKCDMIMIYKIQEIMLYST